jgi:hypothetical protein
MYAGSSSDYSTTMWLIHVPFLAVKLLENGPWIIEKMPKDQRNDQRASPLKKNVNTAH